MAPWGLNTCEAMCVQTKIHKRELKSKVHVLGSSGIKVYISLHILPKVVTGRESFRVTVLMAGIGNLLNIVCQFMIIDIFFLLTWVPGVIFYAN